MGTAPPCSLESAWHVLISKTFEVKMADDRLVWVCMCLFSVYVCVCVFSQVHSTWIWAECPWHSGQKTEKTKIVQSSWMLNSLATSLRSACCSPSLIIYKYTDKTTNKSFSEKHWNKDGWRKEIISLLTFLAMGILLKTFHSTIPTTTLSLR